LLGVAFTPSYAGSFFVSTGGSFLASVEDDSLTYRLTRLKTTRTSDSAVLQNLFYSYDPVGNILAIADTAHQTVFFDNQVVEPSALYEYDALYRLVKVSGREHAGGVGDNQRDQNDLPLHNLPHANDGQALRNYEEEYEYDLIGNILKMIHTAVNSSAGSWTRRYAYGANPYPAPPVNPPARPENNRLHSTSLPGDDPDGPYTATYDHDANGNMVSTPHLVSIAHTYTNQMREADLGGGGTAYYTYDASGERVRKVIQRIGTTREERIYLSGWELYRKRQGASSDVALERETLHVMDDARRIAMVETKTVDADVQGTLPIVPRTRYRYLNQLDSAHLECDETGLVISYEEYHPYGTPAYRSARSGVEVSEKRYRYTGKERDEETGFQYHSARYLAPWLGRWTSADPAGMVDGTCLYRYSGDNPIVLRDPNGRDSTGTDEGADPHYSFSLKLEITYLPTAAPQAASSGKTPGLTLESVIKKELGPGFRLPAAYSSEATPTSTNGSGPLTGRQRIALRAAADEKLARTEAIDEANQREGTSARASFDDDGPGQRDFDRGVAMCNHDAYDCQQYYPASYESWLQRRKEEKQAALGRRASASGISPSEQASSELAVELGNAVLMVIPIAEGAAVASFEAEGAAVAGAEARTLRMPSAIGADVARVRVRHYTRVNALEPIEEANVLEMGDQGSLFTVRASGKPGSPRVVEEALGIKRGKGGAYVEFDAWLGEYSIIKNTKTGATEYVFKGNVDLTDRNAVFRRNQ